MPDEIKLHECYLQATSSLQKFSILPMHHTLCVLHVQISLQTEVNDLLTLARSVVLAKLQTRLRPGEAFTRRVTR